MNHSTIWIDKGLNDRWVRPPPVQRIRPGHDRFTLKEPLGQRWPREIVSLALPDDSPTNEYRVLWNGCSVLAQRNGANLAIRVENLRPGEERAYDVVRFPHDGTAPRSCGIDVTRNGDEVLVTNGRIALRLPASRKRLPSGRGPAIPGPLIAVRRGNGPWMGNGRIESPFRARSVATRVVDRGPLWTTVEVCYRFEEGYAYRVQFQLQPEDAACEIREESSLPLRLWPAPRPYREIGSLNPSFWNQSLANTAKPCTRPCPTSNFILGFGRGFTPDRMVTHSTASWEIMDMPLGSPSLKTYTAMRPANAFIDGGWMGVYHSRRDELLGMASIDIAHWRTPDDMIHPAHRTPGANAEVILCDSKAGGASFRFPIENMTRRWILAAVSRKDSAGLGSGRKPRGKPVRVDPDPRSPLWALRRQRGDLRLDKVKDWILDWPDANHEHPRVLCRSRDLAAIRKKVRAVPELRRAYFKYLRIRPVDRYLLTGKPPGLKAIGDSTRAPEFIANILKNGMAGPIYAIGLGRVLRRYVLACDMAWDSFTPEEKREARRWCALGAYILSDGDWWQYTFRPGETTYLPNFNTDVFVCAGLAGLFLSDHPCSREWVRFLVSRMDIELERYLRRDGGGEENVGGYLLSTWQQLYFSPLWALRHNRVKDYSRDPRVLAGARFLLKILGPSDPRDHGRRMIPPIGHHPGARKDFPLFAWLASFLKKSDPRLASNFMWAWRAMGAPVRNAVDHAGSTANPFTRHFVFHDPTVPESAPVLASHNLPCVGAVLRSHGTDRRGSFLFLKAGRVHSHHDEDEGSFHYFGRGVPLALDGLPLKNGATAEQHNAVTFGRYGQPSGLVERFVTSPAVDYVRARIAPRAFALDAMYVDGTHRSGFERQIVFVKSPKPGGVEYVVVKDVATGPDPCQWNLDVLSRKPVRQRANRIWFPGHREFQMGLDVIIAEPSHPDIRFEKGMVNEDLLSKARRKKLPEMQIAWTVIEHWLVHLPAGPGTTFVVVLFPRRPGEMAPRVDYLEREETLAITHGAGHDLIFLRSNPVVGTSIGGVVFKGRAGFSREGRGPRVIRALDAVRMRRADHPDDAYRVL